MKAKSLMLKHSHEYKKQRCSYWLRPFSAEHPSARNRFISNSNTVQRQENKKHGPRALFPQERLDQNAIVNNAANL